MRMVRSSVHSPCATSSTAARASAPGCTPLGAMIDGSPPTYPDAIEVHTPAEARKAVDRLVSEGVDFLKLYTRIDRSLLVPIMDEVRHLQRPGECAPRPGGREDRGAGGGRLDRAHERHSGGRGVRPVGPLRGARPLLLRRMDRVGACLGRTRQRGARRARDGAGRAAGRGGADPGAARDHEPAGRSHPAAGLHVSRGAGVRAAAMECARHGGSGRVDPSGFRDLPRARGRCRTASSASSSPAGGLIAAGTDAANQLMVPGVRPAPGDGAAGDAPGSARATPW